MYTVFYLCCINFESIAKFDTMQNEANERKEILKLEFLYFNYF